MEITRSAMKLSQILCWIAFGLTLARLVLEFCTPVDLFVTQDVVVRPLAVGLVLFGAFVCMDRLSLLSPLWSILHISASFLLFHLAIGHDYTGMMRRVSHPETYRESDFLAHLHWVSLLLFVLVQIPYLTALYRAQFRTTA
jgi:hypothetical protein